MKLLFIIFLASCFASLSNFYFRKNSCANGNTSAYMCAQYFFSLLTSFFLFESFSEISVSYAMLSVGTVVGCLNVLLMYFISKALKKGPTGAIFAFQNAGAVFPGLLLFLCFGSAYGYAITAFQILGMLLVITGLCCFALKMPSDKKNEGLRWLPYALLCFSLQVITMTLIQWRCLLFCEEANHALIPMTLSEQDDMWFMPGFFGSAFILQSAVLLFEKKPFRYQDVVYGLSGGITNGGSTLLLVLATKLASAEEQAILFPCFAVMVIVLCSAWARIVYREKFDVLSNGICSIGIIISKL